MSLWTRPFASWVFGAPAIPWASFPQLHPPLFSSWLHLQHKWSSCFSSLPWSNWIWYFCWRGNLPGSSLQLADTRPNYSVRVPISFWVSSSQLHWPNFPDKKWEHGRPKPQISFFPACASKLCQGRSVSIFLTFVEEYNMGNKRISMIIRSTISQCF